MGIEAKGGGGAIGEYECSDYLYEKHCDNLICDIKRKGFKPLNRGIHQPAAVNFVEEILGAGPEVINMLKNGYTPLWKNGTPPPPVKRRNNVSAMSKMDFVRSKVREWEEAGFVKQCAQPPTIVSPLSVATKIDNMTGVPKDRVCLDLSTTLNTHLIEVPCKLDDLSCLIPR